MSVQDAVQEDRAKLSFDFDDDDVAEAKEQFSRKVEEISEEAGFTARRLPSRNTRTKEDGGQDSAKSARKRRHRAKTGRTYPFNTKIKEETYDQICRLADLATEKEGRPVSLAETIERAVDALEAQQAAS